MSAEGLQSYLERLTAGAVFTRNRYSESTVVQTGMSADGVLSVVCNIPSVSKTGRKPRYMSKEMPSAMKLAAPSSHKSAL